MILVEGDIDGPGNKIEVWRRAAGGPCLALGRRDIAAVITDDPLELDVPIWPRREVAALTEHLLADSNCLPPWKLLSGGLRE